MRALSQMDVVLESYADGADRYPPGAQGLHMIDTLSKSKKQRCRGLFCPQHLCDYDL